MATQSQPSRSPNPSHRRLQLDIDDEQIEKIDLMRGRRADRKARDSERNAWLETFVPDKAETPAYWELVLHSETMLFFGPALMLAGIATCAHPDDDIVPDEVDSTKPGDDDSEPDTQFIWCRDEDSDGYGRGCDVIVTTVPIYA